MSTATMISPEVAAPSAGESVEMVRLVSQLAQGRISPLKVARQMAVRWALAQSDGNVSHAAEMLGISRGTIYRYARS